MNLDLGTIPPGEISKILVNPDPMKSVRYEDVLEFNNLWEREKSTADLIQRENRSSRPWFLSYTEVSSRNNDSD